MSGQTSGTGGSGGEGLPSKSERMRDKTASKTFLFGKRVEKVLARVFPGRFVPLYYMVSFSRTPYADAVARARTQWRAVFAVAGAVFLAAAAVLAAFLARR